MHIIMIILIALGLAMDAFAVSISSGITIKRSRFKNALKIALFFGMFQAVMPVFGWLIGYNFIEFISEIDHWLVFGLLSLIGCKMIYESTRRGSDKKSSTKTTDMNIYVLLILSIATSIDAFAVGVSFAFLEIVIVIPVIIIGLITFILSFIGVYIGNKLGHFFENKIGVIGGLILIGIGIKVLVEHLII